ncbi:hypothetical protein M422DRAFT_39024 [Sphaerobolus stellatus SS14]|uniref:Unplaced genomic scaffold SPHSTscaffold_384, whole genome shotgun sequence n=1 Tax=Sphaerobolus stellatus (strain SS14) TaxID=990650 RepID=A0A0C9U6L3_SPHS4|nr:hypothetical protein M422DRAFT_39024 [Sphaerobolus stellatus SS14]
MLDRSLSPNQPLSNNLPTQGCRRFLSELSYKYSATFKAHTNFVHSASHAPSGSHFVSTGADYKVFIWYGTSGERGAGFENAHEGGVFAGSWSPDSKSVLASSAYCTVKIWDIETRKASQAGHSSQQRR